MVDVEMKDASKEDKKEKEADNKKEEPADRFYGK